MIFCIVIIIFSDVSDLQKGTVKKSAKQANDGNVVPHEPSTRLGVNNVKQNHAGLLLQASKDSPFFPFVCLHTFTLHSICFFAPFLVRHHASHPLAPNSREKLLFHWKAAVCLQGLLFNTIFFK